MGKREKYEDLKNNRSGCYLKLLDGWCWYTGMVSFYESGVNSGSSDLNQRYRPARYNSARLTGISSV
jgi:hypothetical protein